MANNKTYNVMKDGKELKELKSLVSAKKLADAEGAEVLCEGECVYQGTVAGSEDTVPELSKAETETPVVKPAKPKKYTLTAKMNIRKAPSKTAEIAGIAEKGTVIDVAAIENDWLHLSDGTFILYEGGKFAVRS